MTAPFETLQLVIGSPEGGSFLRIPLPSLIEDPSGDERTERTIAAMTAIIQSTQRTGIALAAARAIIGRRLTDVDYEQRARAIYDTLAAKVTFQPDPSRLEYLRHPDGMLYDLAMKGRATTRASFAHTGDCDDMAMMGCALLLAAGLRPVLITVAIAVSPRDRFVHVLFGYIADGGRVVPMDPQEKFAFGTMATPTRAKVWEVRPSVAFTTRETA